MNHAGVQTASHLGAVFAKLDCTPRWRVLDQAATAIPDAAADEVAAAMLTLWPAAGSGPRA